MTNSHGKLFSMPAIQVSVSTWLTEKLVQAHTEIISEKHSNETTILKKKRRKKKGLVNPLKMASQIYCHPLSSAMNYFLNSVKPQLQRAWAPMMQKNVGEY